MAGIQEVYDLVVKGKAKVIAGAVQEALDAGCDHPEVLSKAMTAAMAEVAPKSNEDGTLAREMREAEEAWKKSGQG